MKNEPLIAALKDYLSKENVEGAFYIDGSWGIGKTFFINSFMQSINNNKKKPTCFWISLSGMKSSDEITSELFTMCHPKVAFLKQSKMSKVLTGFIKMAGNYFGVEGDSFEETKNALFDLVSDHEPKILILDDFERCRIDLQDLFGYINNLIVINGFKIILIGNEIEVRRYLQEEQVFRSKMIAACISNGLEAYSDTLKKLGEPILYDSIKEKCIYKTYTFLFDEDILFKNILKHYPKHVKKIMLKNKNEIKWILSRNNCDNLRTCKTAIENYMFIVSHLRTKFSNVAHIKTHILLTCFMFTTLFKSANDVSTFSKPVYHLNTEIKPILFIKDYVCFSSWNRDKAIKELSSIDKDMDEYLSKEAPDYLKALNDYWLLKTDEEIERGISSLYNHITDVPFYFFYDAIYYFLEYSKMFQNNEYDISKIIVKMKSRIKECNEIIDYPSDYLKYYGNNDAIKEMDKIKVAFEEHNEQIGAKHLSSSLKNMGEYTIQELTKIEKEAYHYQGFFSRIDINELFDSIKTASGEQIISIRQTISSVYSFSNLHTIFKADEPNVRIFKEKVEELYKTEKSNIKKCNLLLLINELNGYLDRLKPENENV